MANMADVKTGEEGTWDVVEPETFIGGATKFGFHSWCSEKHSKVLSRGGA